MATGFSDLIGTSVQRTDALDKALGRTQYGQDFSLPNMLYGGVLRSRYAAARILAVNIDAAKKLTGVHAVMTAKDIPGQKTYGGPLKLDHPALAEDQVRYLGQAIALVAAESRELVAQALDLIEVTYEEMSAVFDPVEALDPSAPQIGPDGNLASHVWVHQGYVDQAFASADVIVEDTYRTTWIEHAALEVECGVAWVDDEGTIVIRVPTQSIEYFQQVAAVLDLPAEKVRIISPMLGGGFGRKLDITVEVYLGLLAWKTRQPVYLECTREESILAFCKRHPFVMHYKTGATRDGHLVALEVDMVADAGPFVYRSGLAALHSLMMATGPYYVPNVKIDVKAAYTNNPITSAMRAVGGPQTNFAYESQMDRLAHMLGMDPLRFRHINYLQQGQSLPNGQVMQDAILLDETAKQAVAALGPLKNSSGSKKVGRGISSNFIGWGFPGNAASCRVELHEDGSAAVSIGVPDIGGGQSSAVAQITADILGIPLKQVSVYIADTAVTPLVGATAGSKTLYYTGNATYQAATAVRNRLLGVAADILEARADDLEVRAGNVYVKDQTKRSIPLTQIIAQALKNGVQLAELSTFTTPTDQKFDPAIGSGIDWLGFTFGTHAADVEVDEETGEVSVLAYAACHDAGRIVHPPSVEGQVQGGVAQGLGFSLSEALIVKDGIILTPSLREYLIPTAVDVPDITTIILESGEGLGAFGNRGMGEPPVTAPLGVIANAIYAAIGVHITEQPITAERVYMALQAKHDRTPVQGALDHQDDHGA